MLLGQPAGCGVQLPGPGTLVRLDRRPDGTVNVIPVSVLVACDPPDPVPHHRLARTLTPPGLRRTVVPETEAISTMMTLSHEATDYFLDLLRERPGVWDVYHPDYQKRAVKETLWDDVVTLMRKNWPAYGPYTAASLRALFKNKRRTYRDERRKIRRLSDQDSDGVYVGKWRYYEPMSFLEPMSRMRELSGAVDDDAGEADTPPPQSYDEVLLPDDPCENNLQFRIISATSMASTTSPPPEVGQSQPESSCKRPREPDASTLATSEFDTERQPVPKVARTVAESADCDDAAVYFGKTVTALLRSLDTRKLVKCQAEILGVIERYLVE